MANLNDIRHGIVYLRYSAEMNQWPRLAEIADLIEALVLERNDAWDAIADKAARAAFAEAELVEIQRDRDDWKQRAERLEAEAHRISELIRFTCEWLAIWANKSQDHDGC